MQAAPLWDPSIRQFVGLLTVTDFIDILRYYRSCMEQNQENYTIQDLATRSIADILKDPNIKYQKYNK